MTELFDTFHPKGYSTVNPYLIMDEPDALLAYLEEVFEAREIGRTLHPESGRIQNMIVEIGHSRIMMAQTVEPFSHLPSAFYLFVSEVDELYEKALAEGARSIYPPHDAPYGDRSAGVQDPFGNYWWISKRLVEKGFHE